MVFQARGAVPTTPWELVLTSSRETQFVLAILAVFSLVSWYLIVLKWWQFRKMRQLGDRFLAEVEKAPRLEDAYHAAMRLPPSPYNRLLREAVHFFSECAKPAGCPILVSPGSGDIGVGYHEPDRMFLFFIKPDRFQPKGAVTHLSNLRRRLKGIHGIHPD